MYGQVSINEASNYVKNLDGSRLYKVPSTPEGEMVFFCPHWSSPATMLNFFKTVVHWQVDPNQTPLFCPREFNQPCPICEVNADLRSRKDDKMAQDLSKEIYAKANYFYNLIPNVRVQNGPNGSTIVFNGDPSTAKVTPFSCGINLHKLIEGFRGFYNNVYDPSNGNAVRLVKIAPPGQDTKFGKVSPTVHPTKSRLDDSLMQLMVSLPDLSKEASVKSYEELKSLIDIKLATFRQSRGSVSVMVPQLNPIPNTQTLSSQLPPNSQITQQPNPAVFIAPVQPQQQVTAQVQQQPTQAINPVVGGGMSDIEKLEQMIKERNAAKNTQK